MPDDYQAVLSVFIFLLCLNLLFWLIIALWRFCTLITLTRAFSFNRIAARFHSIRYYFQRRFHFRRRVTRITNLNNLNGISNRNLDLNSDLPPTYEEALKLPYPCVSTICSNITMNNSSILNIDNLNELNSLNLLNQLDNQNRSNFLLCSGNCNCINHLRQSISDDHSTQQLPESSSTATTSTLNTLTTILDQNPSSTNTSRNLIVETNLTTFSNNKSNLYNESTLNEQKEYELNNQQNLEIRNSQINRSSTFNDLQSYIKNSLNFQNNR